MYTNGKRLLNQSTTPAASFGCMARVNQYDFTTGTFCLVREVLHQLVPGRIRDALSQAVILEHVLTVQLFESKYAVLVYQLAREFVRKVLTPVDDTLVNVLNSLTSFGSLRCAFLSLREFALRLRQFFLFLPEEAGVGYLLAVRKCYKTFQTNVNSYRFFGLRQRFRFNFTRQVGVPVANRIPANVERLDVPANRTVQNYLDHANLGQVQTVVSKLKARLRECETVIPAISPKAGVARLLACLYSTKERLKRQVNPGADFLLNLRVYVLHLWSLVFPPRKQFYCVVMRDRPLLLFPGVLAGSKRLVIHPPAQFKRVRQPGLLALRREKAILKGHSHTRIMPQFKYVGGPCIPNINAGVLQPPTPPSFYKMFPCLRG